jgi:hypothetical protein
MQQSIMHIQGNIEGSDGVSGTLEMWTESDIRLIIFQVYHVRVTL